MQLGVQANAAAFGCGAKFDHAGLPEGAQELERVLLVLSLLGRRFEAVPDQRLHRGAAAFGAAEHRKQHAVANLEARDERLRRGVDQALEDRLVPVHVAPLGRLLAHELLLVLRAGFGFQAQVLDAVLGRQRDHVARVVEALAARAAGDLLKVAHGQDAHFLAVVFAQLGEQHGADRHVHAHAQRVGAADELEQPALGQLLDQQAIARQRGRRGECRCRGAAA